MPSHFRDRIFLTPGNIPQMQSGIYIFNIAQARLSVNLVLDPSILAAAVGTSNVLAATSAASASLDLGASILGVSVGAHSP